MNNHLLPEGFRDSLPEMAEKEFTLISEFIKIIKKHDFRLVKPPLIEFESSLFFLSNKNNNIQSFRVLDPLSQKVMGLRSDITTQIARIACGSLKDDPRPLKLCYFGEILKVNNSYVNTSRQSTQIGAEMINISGDDPEIKIINIINELLTAYNIMEFDVTLSMSTFVGSISNDFNLNKDQTHFLEKNLANKNTTELYKISKDVYETSDKLLKSEGSFEQKISSLESDNFPSKTQIEINKFLKSLKNIYSKTKNLRLIIDPIEIDRSGYHNGIMFKFYSESMRELFSGGKYCVNNEECIGFSSLIENLIR